MKKSRPKLLRRKETEVLVESNQLMRTRAALGARLSALQGLGSALTEVVLRADGGTN